MEKVYCKRLKTIVLFSFILCLLLVYKLASIQLDRFNFFRKKADEQHLRFLELKPKRGTLYDRRMTPLTLNLTYDSFAASPKDMDQQEIVASRLSPLLQMSTSDLMERFRKDSSFVWLTRKVDPEIGEGIRSENLPGIICLDEILRCYPFGNVGRQIIGNTNIDNVGNEGMEMMLDSLLRGTPGECVVEMDASGRRHSDITLPYTPPCDGNDAVLTLDIRCQSILEEEVLAALERHHAKKVMAVVMIPRTGEILAMASALACDSNEVRRKEPSLLKNSVVTDTYEPGSIFKIVAAAAALQEGKLYPEDRIFAENGAFAYAGSVLHDWKKFGWVTFREAIENSCNIATAKVALKVGPEKFYEYAARFGFGCRTGIQFPGEVDGVLRNPATWSGRSLITMALGQEVCVTPLQMVCAFASVANGGELMQPQIVKQVLSQDGTVIQANEPVRIRRVLRGDVVQTLTGFLIGVVDHGTGKKAKVDGFTVAGKTGTAQKAENGTYSKSKFVASFVGFLPAEDPRLAGIIVIDEPKGAYYGGEIAAPLFGQIMKKLVHLPESPVEDYWFARVKQTNEEKVAMGTSVRKLPEKQGAVVMSKYMEKE